MTFLLIFFFAAVLGVIAWFSWGHFYQSQKLAKVNQLNLQGIPLTRALLYATVPEEHLFLDVNYLQRNTQSGLFYTVPISAAAVTRGGIIIFYYLQVDGKILNTDGREWTLKAPTNALSYLPNPFFTLETQAKVLLYILKQSNLLSVPVHAYVVLVNNQTQLLQAKEDIITPNDIPNTIAKYENTKILSRSIRQKTSELLLRFQYQKEA